MAGFPWDKDSRPKINLADIPFSPENPGLTCRTIPFLEPLIRSVHPDTINEDAFNLMVRVSREPNIVTGENPEVGYAAGQNIRLVVGDGTALIPNLYGLSMSTKDVSLLLHDCAVQQQQLIGHGEWQDVTKEHVSGTLEGRIFDVPSLMYLDWCQGDISRYLSKTYRQYLQPAKQFRETSMGLAKPVDGPYLVRYHPHFDKHHALTGADQEFNIYERPDQQAVDAIRRMIPDDLWTNKISRLDPENPDHWFLLLGQVTASFLRGIVSIEKQHEKIQEYLARENEKLKQMDDYVRSHP